MNEEDRPESEICEADPFSDSLLDYDLKLNRAGRHVLKESKAMVPPSLLDNQLSRSSDDPVLSSVFAGEAYPRDEIQVHFGNALSPRTFEQHRA